MAALIALRLLLTVWGSGAFAAGDDQCSILGDLHGYVQMLAVREPFRGALATYGASLPARVEDPHHILYLHMESGSPDIHILFGFVEANESTPKDVAKLFAEVKASGGKVHVAAMLNVRSTPFELVDRSSKFFVSESGVPIIGLGVGPDALELFVHEVSHFRDWKKIRDRYVGEGMAPIDAGRAAWAEMTTPKGVAATERNAVIAQLKYGAQSEPSRVSAFLPRSKPEEELNYAEFSALSDIFMAAKAQKRPLSADEQILADGMMDKILWRTLMLRRDRFLARFVKVHKESSGTDVRNLLWDAEEVSPTMKFFLATMKSGLIKFTHESGVQQDLAVLLATRWKGQIEKIVGQEGWEKDPFVTMIRNPKRETLDGLLGSPLDVRTQRYADYLAARDANSP